MSTPSPIPPHLQGALSQLEATIESIEKRRIEWLDVSWVDIEKSVIKVLGGAFKPNTPEHQMVALGLAAMLGAKLTKELQAFWFVNRDSPEGVGLGFPDALVMLSPFSAVLEALIQSKLERLDEVTREVRTGLAQVKFSGTSSHRLGPADYQSLMDPGYVQVLAMDKAKIDAAYALTPERLSIDLRDALTRARGLPEQAKKQLESQLIGSVSRLERGKPLLDQIPNVPRLGELLAHLFGTVAGTGAAPEELWTDVALPLLLIGSPEKFPELDTQELDLAKHGVDPFLLFLEVTPYSHSVDEDGLLGVFPGESLDLPHPALAAGPQPRLIKVSAANIQSALDKFEPAKTIDAIARFAKQIEGQMGGALKEQPQATQMRDAALGVLADFKKVAASGQMLVVRRLTEAEAASDAALAPLRAALQGPRIILA